jgi:hypothetical protein
MGEERAGKKKADILALHDGPPSRIALPHVRMVAWTWMALVQAE